MVIAEPGGPEVLEERDVPTPDPGPDEIRVKIAATAVNRADLLQRMGLYPAPKDAPQEIPGLEYAGVVDACGSRVNDFRKGDRVFGLASGGTYAEYVVVHERTAAPIPSGISFSDAAAFPEGFLTAYDALVSQGALAPGETVLIHAVGSGVGTSALQIVTMFGGISIGTARSEDKLTRAKELGMTHGVLVKEAAFAREVLTLTQGAGFDLALELVGGAYVSEDVQCARRGGRIMLVGLLAGRSAEVDLGTVLRQRITLRGTVLRSRPLEEKILLGDTLRRHLAPLFHSGKLRPAVSATFSLSEARRAHEAMAANEGFGKIVLSV